MSEFDKEAERRRLREKYESEAADRETTERMSQLLLQGATMTNQHCDSCGSPIFRYQGQEFCPTCQAESGQGQDAGTEDRNAVGREGERPAGQEVDAETEIQDVGSEARGANSAPQGDTASVQTPSEQPNGVQQPEPTAQASRPTGASEAGGPPTPRQQTQPVVSTPETADVATAVDALASTIVTLAARAEQTDDPRRATEFLEAAREAADALDALQQ